MCLLLMKLGERDCRGVNHWFLFMNEYFFHDFFTYKFFIIIIKAYWHDALAARSEYNLNDTVNLVNYRTLSFWSNAKTLWCLRISGYNPYQ